jgi:hypothetical protein
MSETSREPGRTDAERAATIDDVEARLEKIEHVHDLPVEQATDLPQQEPELGYYEAVVRSLREALGRDPS